MYRARLCLFASTIVDSNEDAEDIVHNVFLSLYEKEDELPNIKSLKSYLYRSVYNASLNFLKKKSTSHELREERVQQNLLSQTLSNQEEYLVKRIEEEVIWELFEAIEKLPKESQKIFKMSYLQNISNAEIANLLGISVNTVKSQKQRAKQLLKRELKDLFLLLIFLKQF